MLRNYLKIAWRSLLKNKAFTLINVLGLALGHYITYMKHIYILFIALACISIFNNAQAQTQNIKISGTVTDGAKPVDGAIVILFTVKDSAAVKNVLSNTDGSYVFDNVKNGFYIIKVTLMGYKNYQSQTIVIDTSNVAVPAIVLTPTNNTLNEVSVTAHRSYVEQKIDRTVVNVNALISNNGASALEALAKTPGVLIDQDGKIMYKGKTGVMIMIDDKPTYLSDANLVTYLQSLQASSLDQIELMDNPPAKYDAQGNAGVINIKTKKNTTRGFNASVSAGIGLNHYFGRNYQSININYRVAKLNLFANVSPNYERAFRTIQVDHDFYDANSNPTGTFADYSYFRPENYYTNIKTGLDYFLSSNTTWGIVFTGNYSPTYDNSPANSYIYNKAGALDSLMHANNVSHNIFKNGGVNLNYSHKFDNTGKEITFDADYIRNVSGSDQSFVNNSFLAAGPLTNSQTLLENTSSYINIYAAKSDLTIPLKNKGKFEAGVKSSYVKTDNAAYYFNLVGGYLVPDDNNTNRFLYNENINAAYVNYDQSFGRIAIKFGLRAENTNGEGHQLGNVLQRDSSFARHYINLFPTAYFSYKLDTAGHHILVLSYGRRIGRPNYGDLNPFIMFVDNYLRFQGNPLLNPLFADNYRAAYSYQNLFTVALVYSNINGIQTGIVQQQGNILIATKGNVGNSKTINLSVNSNISPLKWWTMNLYAEVYRNTFTDQRYSTNLINMKGTIFTGNMNNQFALSNGWSAELSGNYRSGYLDPQARYQHTWQLNTGLQKKILNNKGTLRLSANDIFQTNHLVSTLYINGRTSTVRNFNDTRAVTLGFNYSFGKVFNDHKQRDTGSANDESSRAH